MTLQVSRLLLGHGLFLLRYGRLGSVRAQIIGGWGAQESHRVFIAHKLDTDRPGALNSPSARRATGSPGCDVSVASLSGDR
jgi:hypothetical protein